MLPVLYNTDNCYCLLLKKNTIIAHRFLTETTSILRCCLSFTTLTTATACHCKKEYNHCTQISHRNHIYPEMLPVLYNTDNCYCLSLKKNTIIAHRFLTETTSILRCCLSFTTLTTATAVLLKKNTIIAHRFLTETTSILRCCLSFTTLTTLLLVTEKEYNHCTQISHRNHIYPEMLPVLYNTDNCYCLLLKKNTIIAHRFLTETTSILRCCLSFTTLTTATVLLKKNTIIAHRFLTETTSILRCCLSFTTLTTATAVTEKEYNHCTQISHRNHIYPEMLPVLYNTDNCYCWLLKKNTIIAHRFLTETTSILRCCLSFTTLTTATAGY